MENRSKDYPFLFWQKWLFYTSLLFAIAGVCLAFFSKSFLFQPYEKMLATIFWGRADFPKEVELFRAFICGPLGGTIACCYILLAFIAYYPFKEKKKWARNAIIIAFGIWVIIDSSVCFYFGVFAQIYIINLISILVKALPILFTWKEFEKY